jgi:tetratricopeptide (TPR) repeat protein
MHAFTIGQAHFSASMSRLLKGDWPRAQLLVERAIAVFRTGNVVLLLPVAIASSAWALAQLGQGNEALERHRDCEQLLKRHGRMGLVGLSGWAYHALGRASLQIGRLDEARRLANRAIEVSSAHPGFAALAMHLLGEIAMHPDRLDAKNAKIHHRNALALAEPRGMHPLIAHCRRGLGRAYQQTGQRRQASEHLATATRMYRDMDMRFWLDKGFE